MDVRHLRAAIHHHHSIASAPEIGGAPQSRDGDDVGLGQRIPCACHLARFAFRLSPLRDRDQASPFLEAAAPKRAEELVVARVGDRLGLELTPILSGQNHRKAPVHNPGLVVRGHQARIAWVELIGEVGASWRFGAEHARDFIAARSHTVEVAHGRSVGPRGLEMSIGLMS